MSLSMFKMISRWLLRGALAFLVLFVAIALWKAFIFPTSLNEFLFRHRLKEAAGSGAKKSDLLTLLDLTGKRSVFFPPIPGITNAFELRMRKQ
jgi:hypothetical protein